MRFTLIFILSSLAYVLQAQAVEAGVKTGISFPKKPKINAENSISENGLELKDQSSSYHVGLYSQFNLTNIYVRPELYYSHFKSSYQGVENFSLNNNRIDLPILFGKKFGEMLYAHTGIVGSYYFGDALNVAVFNFEKIDDFQFGWQFGGGLKFGKVSLEARYERAFSTRVLEIVSQQYDYDIKTNQDQLLLSIGYQF